LSKLKEQLSLGNPKPLVVAAIPAFNVERTIAKLVLEAQKFVVVCDDGSTDMTGE